MLITIFTPTYNRKHTIDRLYQSLLKQTNYDFEWLVIDDGSTDGTREYFDSIKDNNIFFDVVYKWVENGGKHRAINEGVKMARGKYFFIVDSDDYLTKDAIEKIISWFKSIPENSKFAGVAGNRGYNNTYIGEFPLNRDYVDAKNTERRRKHLLGDKAEVFYTEILRKYPFPSFDGENFLLESVIWNKIAYDGYYIRWHKEIIYICEYLEDGLTFNVEVKYQNNLQGLRYWAQSEVKYNKELIDKFSAIFRFYEYSKLSIKEVKKSLSLPYTIVLFSIIFGRIKRLVKKNK